MFKQGEAKMRLKHNVGDEVYVITEDISFPFKLVKIVKIEINSERIIYYLNACKDVEILQSNSNFYAHYENNWTTPATDLVFKSMEDAKETLIGYISSLEEK